MFGSLLTFLLVGLVALVALGVGLAVVGALLGIAIGLATFLLFKVAPVVLIGYVVVRLLRPRRKQISAEDRKWLES
ncbi:MAG TPA: hypothetical protein VFQ38_01915 [Longimicrobiales bacterium]|nr:hypothetical protein [Longimicrobiales bacterium]